MRLVRTDYPLADEHCQGTLALSMTGFFTLFCSYYHQDIHSIQVHILL